MPLSKVFQAYTSMNWQTHYTSKPAVFRVILKLLSLHSSPLIPRKCCNFDKHCFYCKAVIWFIPQTELHMWTVSMYILCYILGSQQELSMAGQWQCTIIRCRLEQHAFARYLCKLYTWR